MGCLRRFPAEIGVLLFVVSMLGCASRPDEALKLAQDAMDAAKQESAADFAAADWKSAEKAWNDAQTALSSQRYTEAATLLTTARSRFEKARTIAKAKRDVVSQEVSMVQNTVNTRLSALKNRFEASKVTGKPKKELGDSLGDLELAVDKFNSEVLNGKLIEARASGQTALQKLNELEKSLSPGSRINF